MYVSNKSRKISMNFFEGDFKRMIRDDFKVKGWKTYSESPYAEYKRRIEDAVSNRFENNNENV